MAIVDDYATIAAELRRLRASEKLPDAAPADSTGDPAPKQAHRMRATASGELLYRRLVMRRAVRLACRIR
jgi:hypothetical protein